MIELYIFDQGGVLARDFDIGPEAASRLGLTVEEFRRIAAYDLQAFMRGDFDPAEFWRRFESRGGGKAPEDFWTTLYNPSLDRPTFDLVRELRDARFNGSGPRRFRVVGGTNTIGPHYATHLERGDYSCFDAVYASHLMGRAKPEPEFWLDILRAENVRPENVFFADDYPENVAAAGELGIHARLYLDATRLRADLLELGAPLEAPRGSLVLQG